MELQNCDFLPFKGIDFTGVLHLMQLQNLYIIQLHTHIDSLSTDFNIFHTVEFKEFMTHFNLFIRNHARSEGFSNAMEILQVYHHSLLDKLLTSDVLAAAEELEMAIVYLEMLVSQSSTKTNTKIIVLEQSISILEETQLKIIERLEQLLLIFSQKHLEN